LLPPGDLAERVGTALRTGAWNAGGLALDLGLRLLASGAVARLEAAKREDAAARQRTALDLLAGLQVRGGETSYHLWLELPAGWRAEAFAAAALRADVVVTPAAAFTVGAAHAPQAVRLALAAPPPARLREGLEIVARLARSGPDGEAFD
jgi:DNA-binding transcriptional MocR family regulator